MLMLLHVGFGRNKVVVVEKKSIRHFKGIFFMDWASFPFIFMLAWVHENNFLDI